MTHRSRAPSAACPAVRFVGLPERCSRDPRVRSRGLTLIEILVVITIIAVVGGFAIAGSMQLSSARLRRSATMIASAIKVAYTRTTATSRDLRLAMDLDTQKIWLEQSDVPMLVQSRDKVASGGADAITEAEKAAVEEGNRIVQGPPIPKPKFKPIEVYGFGDTESGRGGKPLQSGIAFRAIQTAHDDSARTSGRAYLYFWPGGRTERASIQLRVGKSGAEDQTLTLLVSPLTGKVTIKSGAVDLELPLDDKQSSDREDTGL
jgi:general secretion pathway protein H